MEYSAAEYNKSLGCYIKWVHGDPDQVIDRLYCMSAFHFFTRDTGFILNDKYKKYAEYLYVSVLSIVEHKDSFVRVYFDDSVIAGANKERAVWQGIINKLKIDNVQLVFIKMPRYYSAADQCHQGLLATLFRFLPVFDPAVRLCIFRDIDNIWTEQDDYFIDRWLNGATSGTAEDIFLFMNENYKRSEPNGLTRTDILMSAKQYNTILAGIWALKKRQPVYDVQLWQRMFAYIETYSDVLCAPNYAGYRFYNVRFTYGCDELSLSRIFIPMVLAQGHRIFCLPIKIYDADSINSLFSNVPIGKFTKTLFGADANPTQLRDFTLGKYWNFMMSNAGLPQYIICLLSNIYFRIAARKSRVFKNEQIIAHIKDRVYPVPLLMGVGLFTFSNYKKYSWYTSGNVKRGRDLVDDVVNNSLVPSLAEWTAGSDLSNNWEGVDTPTPPDTDPDGSGQYGI